MVQSPLWVTQSFPVKGSTLQMLKFLFVFLFVTQLTTGMHYTLPNTRNVRVTYTVLWHYTLHVLLKRCVQLVPHWSVKRFCSYNTNRRRGSVNGISLKTYFLCEAADCQHDAFPFSGKKWINSHWHWKLPSFSLNTFKRFSQSDCVNWHWR